MAILEVSNVNKIYKNTHQALTDLSLSVEQGDFFALLGPNGAGKTTLINILCSLVHKTSGDVVIDGYNIDKDFNAVKSTIGVMPQEFNFITTQKVVDILIYQAGYFGIPRGVAKARAVEYLKKLELLDKQDTPARALSGGMKRRLMVARALMHQPKILILDEPTAGVDIEVRRLMYDYLRELNEKGTTIILTTHYLEEAEKLCRNIAILDKGQVVERSSMSVLMEKLSHESYLFVLSKDLEYAPECENFQLKLVDSNTLEVEVQKGQHISELMDLLSRKGLKVVRVQNKANRLEELFLQLVVDREGS